VGTPANSKSAPNRHLVFSRKNLNGFPLSFKIVISFIIIVLVGSLIIIKFFKEKTMRHHSKIAVVILWALLSIAVPLLANAADSKAEVDPKADQVLRQMCDYLKAQKHIIARAETSYESILDSGQKLTYMNQVMIYLKRPDRLYIHRTGMIRNQDIFYNGKTLTLYSRNKNVYASTEVPPTIDEMLDYATDVLNLPAPGSDLFYSDVYEGLTSDVYSGTYVGKNRINGVLCHHIAFRAGDVDWQLWIEAGDEPIPRKYIITSKWITGAPEYSMTIREWDTKTIIPESRFQFNPPKGANRIMFLTPEEINAARAKIVKEHQK